LLAILYNLRVRPTKNEPQQQIITYLERERERGERERERERERKREREREREGGAGRWVSRQAYLR
jgi:hypothetical protein